MGAAVCDGAGIHLPACEYEGGLNDILLGVACRRAHGMELEKLPPEILIEGVIDFLALGRP